MIGGRNPLFPRRSPLAPSIVLPAVVLVVVWLVATTTGPFSSTVVNDLYVYSVYSGFIHDGLIPYRDFAFEYPPLALVPIAALGGHEAAWSAAMLACALVCQWCAGRLGGPRAAWAMAALPLLAGAMVRTHFDLLATALTMCALVVYGSGRGRSAALLAAATMVKLWPAVVAAARLRGRFAAGVFLAVCAAVAIPALLLGAWDLVEFHLRRPVQIESTPASVLFGLGGSHVTGHPVLPDEFKSNGLAGGVAGIVGPLFTATQILSVGLFAWHARRNPLLGALGAALAFVSLGKVLSPQYMLWLFPLAVAAGGVPAVLVALATALTQVEFPTRYFDLVSEDQAMVAVVAARNALLIAAAVATALALARSSPPGRAPSSERRRH